MKRHYLSIALGTVNIILALFLVQSNNRIQALESRLAERTEAPAETKSTTLPPKPHISAKADSELNPENLLTSELDQQPEEEQKEAERKRVMGSMAKMMMENPTMNKVMEASQRGALSALYVDLIDFLELNPEETKYFMDLLMHRQMKNVEAAMQIMGGQLSPEERLALREEMNVAGEEVEAEMKTFLNNPEDYEEFQFYEKTIGERMILSQVDAKLAGTENALPDDTYREVLEIMHEERQNFTFSDDLGDQKNTDYSADRFSQENIDRYIEETLRLGEQIDARLSQLLTPEQMDAYHESGKAMLDMHIGQLHQAKQMFGGK